MNIYFSGSIYGGRQKLDSYKKLVKELGKFGKVLTEEVASDNVLDKEENISDNDVFMSLEHRLDSADLIFAEVTIPSLGVGYEIGYADKSNKRIICVYDKTVTPKITTMLRGNNRLKIIPYTDINEIINNMKDIIEEED